MEYGLPPEKITEKFPELTPLQLTSFLIKVSNFKRGGEKILVNTESEHPTESVNKILYGPAGKS